MSCAAELEAVLKVKKSTEKRPKVTELWIGLTKQVLIHTRNERVQKPRIINCVNQLIGFRGPLKLHWIEDWQLLPDARELQDQTNRMIAAGERVENVFHRTGCKSRG
jgi:hypothetical protein